MSFRVNRPMSKCDLIKLNLNLVPLSQKIINQKYTNTFTIIFKIFLKNYRRLRNNFDLTITVKVTAYVNPINPLLYHLPKGITIHRMLQDK